jgi:D-arabinose 1-dehydrogenase-like Zn-dependent alcohol dehydrogenase
LKAGRLFEFNAPVRIVDLPDPKIEGPLDIIVKVGGAGVCGSDINIQRGLASPLPKLPYTLGHENAGWIEEVGSVGEMGGLRKGDTVILHPHISCGLCRACRAGNDMHCINSHFPGVNTDGGYAQFMKTSVRSVIKLPDRTDPVPLAPYADAGITSYHAVKKLAPLLYPGSTAVVIGIGGLGHFAIQLLKVLTTASVIGIARSSEKMEFAKKLGADAAFQAGNDGGLKAVRDFTNGVGADVVLDFVADQGTPDVGVKMIKKGGTYSIVGEGGTLSNTTIDMVVREINLIGNYVGTYNELSELMELNHMGRIRATSKVYPMSDVAKVMKDLKEGRIIGRAVLDPWK